MRYFLLVGFLLFLSCPLYHVYNLPEQIPTFQELGIDGTQFNTVDKITIYVDTVIKTRPTDDCGVMPWDVMIYEEGDIYAKAGLVVWLLEKSGLVEQAFLVSGGARYSERTWYVVDELENPVWNYRPEYVNTYTRQSLKTFIFNQSQNPCVKIVADF